MKFFFIFLLTAGIVSAQTVTTTAPANMLLNDYKVNVRVATTANVTIATALNAGDTIDGVTLAANDRVLVKSQSTASQNGIYVVSASPARASDSNSWAELPGAVVIVTSGSTNGDTFWINTSAETGTVGSTSITYSQITGGGGGGAGDFLADGSIPMTGALTFTGTTHPGIRLNNLTTTQRDAMTPLAGYAIWNTTKLTHDIYNGTAWFPVAPLAPRIQTVTDASPVTVTLTSDTVDMGVLEGTGTGTITIAAPTGTPAPGQRLQLRIKSTSARTLSFNAAFRFSTDMPAPTATSSSSLTDYLVFQWNDTASKWDCVGKNFGF